MRTLSKSVFRNRKICIKLNKYSGDDILIPVIYAAQCVEFLGPTTPPVLKP